MGKKWIYVYILITSFLFLLRVLFFALDFGGVEHDSGWFMGVARNLAQRGIYASYTNTIKEEEVGANPSLHGRFSVQDEEGYSYFPAGVTAGPGYVIPQAILFKTLGFGFWQYRAWPLVAFAAMLVLLFYLTYQLGGMISLIILQVWLWFYPQFYISFAHEGFGEHIALLYLLISFYLLWLAIIKKKKRWIMFSSGIFFSLSILTKNLSLLTGGAFVVAGAYDLYRSRRAIKKAVIRWGFFLLGVFLPIGFFELYRYLSLTSRFGISGWEAINKDISLHFKINGSGTGIKNVDWEHVSRKINVWSKLGLNISVFPWMLLFLSPLAYLRKTIRKKKILFLILFAALAPFNLWYLYLSPTGWTRHAWLGLMLSMVVLPSLVSKFFKVKKRLKGLVLVVVIIFFGWIVIKGGDFEPRFFINQSSIDRWRMNRYEGGLQGMPHADTFSLVDQKRLVEYFQDNINKNDRIYYVGWFLVAEASPLVDKVFYTLDRYLDLGQINPEGGFSYLILGPYQKGKLSIIGNTYHDIKVAQLCQDVVFGNPSYTMCTLKTGLIYENRAYD